MGLPNEPARLPWWRWIARLQMRTGKRCWCGVLHPGIGHNPVVEGVWPSGPVDKP